MGLVEWFFRKLGSAILLIAWFAVTSPPVLILIWLRDHDRFSDLCSILILPVALAWIIGSKWLYMKTAHYMFEEKQLFLTAVKYTLSDLRLKLAFLPGVRHLFNSDEDRTRPPEE
jgi:hypothetical protein